MVDEIKPVHPVARRPRWPFTRRQIIGQVIVAAVILASGIGIGVGGTILSLKDRIIRPTRFFDERRGPPDVNELITRWRTDLSLTDEQARQIKDMFDKRWAAAREQWVKMMELQRKDREEFVASMKSILTPEQFQKWEDEFKKRERHFQEWRRDGPKGPGGPGGRGRPGGRGNFDGPDRHRGDRGPRGMGGPEPPPDGPQPNSPPPDGPAPDNPPPQ